MNDKVSIVLKAQDVQIPHKSSENEVVFFGKIISAYPQGDKWNIGVKIIS